MTKQDIIDFIENNDLDTNNLILTLENNGIKELNVLVMSSQDTIDFIQETTTENNDVLTMQHFGNTVNIVDYKMSN